MNSVLKGSGHSLIEQTAEADRYICTTISKGNTCPPLNVKVCRFSLAVRPLEGEKTQIQRLKAALRGWKEVQDEAPSGVYIDKLLNFVGSSPEDLSLVITTFHDEGNILVYLESNSYETSFLYQMVLDVSTAAAFLHSRSVVHGNICANNIFVGQDGHAYLSDIGIHEAVRCSNFSRAWRHRPLHSEYMLDKDVSVTFADDVHAFGMTIYEIYSGRKPFAELRDSPQTIVKIVRCGLPKLEKPPKMPDAIWSIVRQCTCRDGDSPRPNMQAVVDNLLSYREYGKPTH